MPRLLAIGLLITILFQPLHAAVNKGQSATAVVEQFHSALIAAMKKSDKLGFKGRYKLLKPAIKNGHDLPGITKVVAGRYWSKLSDRDKELLIKTFSKLIITTYAARFDEYSGEKFKTLSEEHLPNGDILVRTQLVKSDGEKLSFDYVLRNDGKNWRVRNIIVDGVSDLAIKRTEYTSILRGEGVKVLIEKLKEKITRQSAPTS